MRVKEYFPDEELSCSCGCGKLPDRRFIERLYAMRLLLQFPLNLSSCARCVPHNRKEGGAKDSAHLIGAADIVNYDIRNEGLIVEAALKVGMTGLGISDNKFIHVDDKHGRLTLWGY